MSYISAELRLLVIQRAANRCEYCGLSQDGQEATFHIAHIIPIVYLIGQTATGRCTISAMNRNRKLILAIRREEILLGRHPPPN